MAAWLICTAMAWPRQPPESPRSTRCSASPAPRNMPRFEYRALRPTGSEIAGGLFAADERDAAARLQEAGNYPIEISALAGRPAIARPRAGRRLAARDLILFTRQLAAL